MVDFPTVHFATGAKSSCYRAQRKFDKFDIVPELFMEINRVIK